MTPARSFDRAQPLILLLAVLAVVVIALTGCGGGDDADDDLDLRCEVDGLPRQPEVCNR